MISFLQPGICFLDTPDGAIATSVKGMDTSPCFFFLCFIFQNICDFLFYSLDDVARQEVGAYYAP